MIDPSGWVEPFQTPEFDEITFIINGKKVIVIDGDKIVLGKNQSFLVKKDTCVQYSNPFDETCKYVSVCTPAFIIKREKSN